MINLANGFPETDYLKGLEVIKKPTAVHETEAELMLPKDIIDRFLGTRQRVNLLLGEILHPGLDLSRADKCTSVDTDGLPEREGFVKVYMFDDSDRTHYPRFSTSGSRGRGLRGNKGIGKIWATREDHLAAIRYKTNKKFSGPTPGIVDSRNGAELIPDGTSWEDLHTAGDHGVSLE